MSTIATAPPPTRDLAPQRPPNGGAPATRAVARWGVRLLRREWRQQLLVVGLLTIAVAATCTGLAVATTASNPPSTTWILPGSDSRVAADVAAIQTRFGPVSVFAHHSVPIAGSVGSIDLRALEPDVSFPTENLELLAGRLPANGDEVALSPGAAAEFGVGVGDTWRDIGHPLRVVGIVRDPTAFDVHFALLGGPLDVVDNITARVGVDVPREQMATFHLPSGAPNQIDGVSTTSKTQAAVAVLTLATLTLVFVGLVSVASYSVIAQRRQRALGTLASMGATDRHVRLVMSANGAAAGAVAAVAGVTIGLGAWFVYAPHLEGVVGHHIDPVDLPWWALIAAVTLAVLTSTAAAWWPARALARGSIVSALAARPPRPKRAGHVALTGLIVLTGGLVLLAFGRPDHAVLIVAGIVATVIGVVLFGPLAIRATAALAPRFPVGIRLALRDLGRYQTRSGAALGAATLAIGIAGIITVTSASQIAKETANGGNLPANELIAYLPGGIKGGPSPQLSSTDLSSVRSGLDAMAAQVGAHDVVELDTAIDPSAPVLSGDGTSGQPPVGLADLQTEPGGGRSLEIRGPLYIATPQLLAADGIAANSIDPTADVISSRNDIAGMKLILDPRSTPTSPHIQHVALPAGTSEPNTLLTENAVARLGLESQPAAWLLRAPQPLTAAQINAARRLAAGGGLSIETRDSQASLAQLGHDATAGGILFALVVLAMTVGLIRSETGNDLRILTATGASSRTRRNITAATAGVLAFLAAVLGLAEAYLALGAFYRGSLDTLSHPPVADLIMMGIGLPALAAIAGWLLSGRPPPAIARRPIE
jgi:putative ABC transport system permease protein